MIEIVFYFIINFERVSIIIGCLFGGKKFCYCYIRKRIYDGFSDLNEKRNILKFFEEIVWFIFII